MTLRFIDHLVLPTGDLGVARARLSALGFTVAPQGLHPFGTKNACVYFSDGVFIEPLAVDDATIAEAAAAAGNVFVARDRIFRRQRGDDGFSAVVMATQDADADHVAFLAAGLSAGRRLDFSRDYVDDAGASKTVSFRLAFAAPPAVSDIFFFTCERVDQPASGRGALAVHANGVTGLCAVVASSREPHAMEGLLTALAGKLPEAGDDGLRVETANAPILLLRPGALAARFRVAPPRNDELSLCGVVFSVANLIDTAALLQAAGVAHHEADGLLVVPAAPGQGAFFAFRETAS